MKASSWSNHDPTPGIGASLDATQQARGAEPVTARTTLVGSHHEDGAVEVFRPFPGHHLEAMIGLTGATEQVAGEGGHSGLRRERTALPGEHGVDHPVDQRRRRIIVRREAHQKHLGHASAEMTRRYQRRRDRYRVNLTKAAGL